VVPVATTPLKTSGEKKLNKKVVSFTCCLLVSHQMCDSESMLLLRPLLQTT
jgi:hypothetical protein